MFAVFTMTSERTREQRLYGEDETGEILRRAAQLDAKKQHERPALSLDEIEAIARDSGIDPQLVRQAARDVQSKRSSSASAKWLGAPVRFSVERVVDGEVTTDMHEALAADIRATIFGSATVSGQMSVVGRSLSWSGFSTAGSLNLELVPRDGKTYIRIDVNASQIAGGLFGGIIGGVGGGLGTNVAWMLPGFLHLPVVAGIGGFLAVVGLAYGLARALFVWRVRALHQRLEQLADRLEIAVTAGLAARRG